MIIFVLLLLELDCSALAAHIAARDQCRNTYPRSGTIGAFNRLIATTQSNKQVIIARITITVIMALPPEILLCRSASILFSFVVFTF
jgi:hypothetical protein